MSADKMRLIKRVIKTLIANTLYYTGLLSLIKNSKFRDRACVLAYHRILPEGTATITHSANAIITDSELFRQHLRWLKEEFQIIDMAELQAVLLNDQPLAANSLLITFDDGWWDNYTYAMPSLAAEGVPATIFLPYDYIGTGEVFWQEEMLARLTQLTQCEDASDRALLIELAGIEGGADKELLRSVVTKLKAKPYAEIYQYLERLRRHQQPRSIDMTLESYLDWQQIKQMGGENISFGSHALSHRVLTRIELEEARHEISESKKLIRERIGKEVETIAYPNGNCNSSIEQIVAESGYQLGFTITRGYVAKDSNPMALPRLNIHTANSSSKPLFLCSILNIL
ncbi:MAG: polysaccharide deacetylase family protein [Candidatus Thiodiazotropha sp.]